MKYRYDKFNHNEFEVHRLVLDMIGRGSRVLDVGCATGYFAKELLKKNCETWGLDGDKEAVKKAGRYCKKAIVFNLDRSNKLKVPEKYFDYIIILDVIEHLLHPEYVLSTIKPHLKNGGAIIISTPNIAHASTRWMLLRGVFEYTSIGIVDRTHVHFYTQTSFRELLKKNGFKISKMIPTDGMCKVPFLYKISDRLPKKWQYWLVSMWPRLFSFQFIAVVKLTN